MTQEKNENAVKADACSSGEDLATFERIGDLRFNKITGDIYSDVIAQTHELGEQYSNEGIASAGKFMRQVENLVVKQFKSLEAAFEEAYIKPLEETAGGITQAKQVWLTNKAEALVHEQLRGAQVVLENTCSRFGTPAHVNLHVVRLQGEGAELHRRLNQVITLAALTKGPPALGPTAQSELGPKAGTPEKDGLSQKQGVWKHFRNLLGWDGLSFGFLASTAITLVLADRYAAARWCIWLTGASLIIRFGRYGWGNFAGKSRWIAILTVSAIIFLPLVLVIDPWIRIQRQAEQSPRPRSGEATVAQPSKLTTTTQATTPTPIPQARKPTFSELPGDFVVLIGHTPYQISPTSTKKHPTKIAPFGDSRAIQAYVEHGKLYVDALLYYSLNKPPLQLIHNTLRDQPPQWDRNFDDSAIEIVDEKLTPRFQLIYKNARTAMLRGVFQFPKGDGAVVFEEDKNRFFVGSLEDTVRIARLFKYPSRLYQGVELSQSAPPPV